MELRRYAALALKWLWLLVLGTLVAGGVAYQVSRVQTPIYQAQLQLMVNQTQSANGPDYSSLLASQNLTQTYAELITSRRVLDAAYQKLGLNPLDQASPATAQVVRSTQLVTLSVEDASPQRARDLATAIAEVFIQQRVADQMGQTAASEKVLQQQIADLEKEMRDTSAQIEQAKAGGDAQAGNLQRLQGVLSQYQVTYAQLAQSENAIQLANARFANAITIVEPAVVPTIPVRPKVLQNTLLAAVVGLLLALGAVFLVEYLDDTVKGEEDVEEASGLPTLAVIGRAKNAKGDRPLLNSGKGAHQLAEAFRVLRVNVGFAWAGKPGQVIEVTSPGPSEGKTTTAANLGMILAQDSRRVILVDADLRRPSLHNAFDLDSKQGLTDLLADPRLAVASRLRETAVPNVRVLPAGPTPPNPAELLGSERFGEVVAELKREADVVVIDTPPLLGAVDPAVVGRVVDGAIVVVAAGETRAGALGKGVEILSRSAVRVLGVALNKATRGNSSYYYHYYYGHQSGHERDGGENGREGGHTGGHADDPSVQSGDSPNGKARVHESVEQK